jgi:hypothetical protein
MDASEVSPIAQTSPEYAAKCGLDGKSNSVAEIGLINSPLADLRALDLSAIVLGQITRQYLGDIGAEVTKIEAPEGNVTGAAGPRRSEGGPIGDCSLWG